MKLDDTNLNARRTIIFLCCIMLLFTVVDIVEKDKFFSSSENRILASRPELSWEAIVSGKYMEDYETYVTDQFVSRDKWIMLKTGMDMLLQKKAINGVYLAEDDYLIEQHLPEEEAFTRENMVEKLKLVRRIQNKYPQLKLVLVPTADNILTDKLPRYATYFDQTALQELAKKAVGEENVVDLFPTLQKHAEEEIYYKTDHHWTTLGAYYSYKDVARGLGIMPYTYTGKDFETVSRDFQGTLHSKINMPVASDRIHIIKPTKEMDVKLVYDMDKKTDSFYEESYLEGKNKYGYFLDDNHSFIEIEANPNARKDLFVIKDSYANSMIPMLSRHYRNVYVVDLRYYKGPLFQLMNQYDQGNMDVLVLYNCVHFLETFNFY